MNSIRSLIMKKAPAYDVPTLESVLPEYAELMDRRRKLVALQASLNEQWNEVSNKLHLAARNQSSVVTDEDVRVGTLLGDEVKGATLKSDRDLVTQLQQQMDDCRRALDVLADRIRVARREASQRICLQLADAHKALVKDIADGLIALHRANAAYDEFAGELIKRDVAWTSLRPSHPTFIGSPKDRHGIVAHYLRELIRNDLIPGSMLPEELQ